MNNFTSWVTALSPKHFAHFCLCRILLRGMETLGVLFGLLTLSQGAPMNSTLSVCFAVFSALALYFFFFFMTLGFIKNLKMARPIFLKFYLMAYIQRWMKTTDLDFNVKFLLCLSWGKQDIFELFSKFVHQVFLKLYQMAGIKNCKKE